MRADRRIGVVLAVDRNVAAGVPADALVVPADLDELVALGWKYDGVGCLSGGDVPVYRQYNPNAQAGSHNFTTSKEENDQLVKVGWSEEGIAWMSM